MRESSSTKHALQYIEKEVFQAEDNMGDNRTIPFQSSNNAFKVCHITSKSLVTNQNYTLYVSEKPLKHNAKKKIKSEY